ncbi:MAG: MBL fold metallo-hydrolase [Patescibacteria group bacterium]|nr:MBL fold metallo-hydrolase [Patescibacteria group bacterium]MDE2015194.1 MBL fold metallo-hydrolase [Patescibacteria group bacterium]MDE2226621.1 MBL fold metallo-hydrolase [Patescibacteria group bacterium]
MVINYLGNGSFRLQSGETSLLVNPENNRFKADVVLRTLSPVDLAKDENAAPNEISFAGEYEIKGVEITGIALPEESGEKFLKTAYSVKWEDIKLAFLGHMSKMPSSDIMERLAEPDVLFLPVGGGHFLSPELAAKLVKQIEPAFVIPDFYKSPADFLKAMGQKAEPQEKLVFKKKDLENSKSQVIVLKT